MARPCLMPRRLSGAARFLFAAAVILSLLTSLWPTDTLIAQSGITSPTPGSAVSGDVIIMGSAVNDQFQRYELHYKLEPSGDDAYIYFASSTNSITNGQLGVWSAGGLPAGTYSLRLRVVKVDGNYDEYYTPGLTLGSSAVPTDTPTPEASPTSSEPTPTAIPTSTFTPAPQPTVAVGQVAQPGLEGQAAPAPTVAEVAAVPNPTDASGQPATTASTTTLSSVTGGGSEEAGGSVTREIGEALSLNRLRGQFFNGMRISAALFLGFIALYGGKRLFDWVWAQFS